MRTSTILLAALVVLCVIADIEGKRSRRKATRSLNDGRHKGRSQSKPRGGGRGHVRAARRGGAGRRGRGGTVAGGKLSIPLLRGVNRSGTEYVCIKPESTDFFEGPVNDEGIDAMMKWNINAVRVPLNEQCWLGDTPNPALGKENYKKAIKGWVERLRKKKLYVIVDLHWTQGMYTGDNRACDVSSATCQKPMPGKEAIKFWKEVANMFKNDNGIIFDVFNEPFPDMPIKNIDDAWKCWRNGGKDCPESVGFKYEVAGMNDLVNAVRSTGAKNLIMLGGLTWANNLEKWMDYLPDKKENIAAAMHSYNFNACSNEDCWQRSIGKIKEAGHRVIVGEIGEHGCTHDYIDKLMKWLDSKDIDYIAWTFNNWDCSSGPALITNFNGEPTSFGKGYKDHLENQKAKIKLSP